MPGWFVVARARIGMREWKGVRSSILERVKVKFLSYTAGILLVPAQNSYSNGNGRTSRQGELMDQWNTSQSRARPRIYVYHLLALLTLAMLPVPKRCHRPTFKIGIIAIHRSSYLASLGKAGAHCNFHLCRSRYELSGKLCVPPVPRSPGVPWRGALGLYDWCGMDFCDPSATD